MTLREDDIVITYTGDGHQTIFDIPFRLFDPDNLKVTINGEPYYLGSHYAVTIENESDSQLASVTFFEAPEGSVSLTRNMPIEQRFDFSQVSQVDGATLEEALDQVVAIIAQIKLQSGESLTLPLGSVLSGELPEPISGGFLSVSDDGETWEFSVPEEHLIAVSDASPDASRYVLWYDQVNRQLKYWTGDSWTSAPSADSSKIDRVVGGDIEGRIPTLTPTGGLISSGLTVSDLQSDPLDHDRLADVANMTPEQGTVIIGNGDEFVQLSPGVEGSVLTVDRSSIPGLRYVPPATGVIREVDKTIITNAETPVSVVMFSWSPGEYRKIELIGHALKPDLGRSAILVQLGYDSGLDSVYWAQYAWTYLNSSDVHIHRVASYEAILVPPDISTLGIDGSLQHSAIWFSLTVGNLSSAMSPIFNLLCGSNVIEGAPASHNATGVCRTVTLNQLSRVRVYWRGSKSFRSGGELSLIGYK